MSSSAAAPAKKPVWKPSEIPPFPAVAVRALNLMAGTDTSLLELCNLVRPDLAFSAEVLRIANSPLVGFPKSVNSVLQASMILGFRRLRSVVLTVGLKSYLAGSYTPAMHACWRHSLACAVVAERSAKACSLDKDFAYTAGIMHDIGRVALAISMPKEYSRVLDREVDLPQDLLSVERELCGLDHCQAAATLVGVWGLPEVYSQLTSCHHEPLAAVVDVPSIVRLSCLLADSIGFGVVHYRTPSAYLEILDKFPEAARWSFPAKPEELAAEVGEQVRLIETA